MKVSTSRARTVSPANRSHKYLWLSAVLLCWLWAAPAWAQAGRVLVDDPDRLFGDGSAVRSAAQRLAGEGADVVVVGVRNAGVDGAAAQRYIDNRVQQLGIAQSTHELHGNQIVFYVAPKPGYDGVYFVSRYKDKLQPVYRQIITQQMRPRFTQEDYSGGMTAGIDAIRTTLNPPTSPVVWVGAAVAGLAIIVVVARPMLLRRRIAADQLSSARGRMDEARRAAGVALADLGQRVSTARDKAQYDKISYSAGDAARITDLQTRGEALFADAQSAFDAAEQARTEANRPSAADYDSIAQKYANAQQLAQEAMQPIEEAERIRATLDKAGAPSTGQTQRL